MQLEESTCTCTCTGTGTASGAGTYDKAIIKQTALADYPLSVRVNKRSLFHDSVLEFLSCQWVGIRHRFFSNNVLSTLKYGTVPYCTVLCGTAYLLFKKSTAMSRQIGHCSTFLNK